VKDRAVLRTAHAATLLSILVCSACGGPNAPAGSPEPAASHEARPEPTSAPNEPAADVTEAADPGPTTCRKSSDCVLTTFTGCCACCPGLPRTVFKPDLDAAERKCDAVRCRSCEEDCGPAVDVTTYAARCEDGKCVAVPL
jgi:hypothetical protein